MKTILIVHFQPLEKYPPVMNMLRYLASIQQEGESIHVLTSTASTHQNLFEQQGVVIHRLAQWKPGISAFARLGQYWNYYSKSLKIAFKLKPTTVFYYETLSAFVPWLWIKVFGRKPSLFIHYHEYTSKEEFSTGMKLVKWFHKLEKDLYKNATWISQTNEHRNRLFAADLDSDLSLKVLPNYPPAEWRARISTVSQTGPVCKLVYVGALSLDTTYLKEIVDFVRAHQDSCTLVIYSDNISGSAQAFLQQHASGNVQMKGAIVYDKLPEVLTGFDIGLILYKGHIPNYIYNAPNKLFEYLACGLNVWYPKEVIGCDAYQSETAPKVSSVDFSANMFPELTKRQNETVKNGSFFADSAYGEIGKLLLERG